MCLIALAWRVHPRYPLALIANRDEFHERPTAPAGSDPGSPDVYGGRDLRAGGGWLMVSTRGRLAAVTNVRDGRAEATAPLSRGALVRAFVEGDDSARDHLAALHPGAPDYGRYNLLAWDGVECRFATNHPRFRESAIAPGLHAMSNGAFDAPWPKSGHATRALAEWLSTDLVDAYREGNAAALAPLFAALAETTPAPDALLPDTGVGRELERALSPPFVRGQRYGTRCSSVVLVGEESIHFIERRFGPDAAPLGESAATLPRARQAPSGTAQP